MIWGIARIFHFPPGEIMGMGMDELKFWADGAGWVGEKMRGSDDDE